MTSAVNDVLQHAIAFEPSVIVARDRIYLLLLIADDDGAAILKGLSEANTDEL